MIENFYAKPRATFSFLSCSLLSCARLTIGLDHVRTPGGMVTDNSQLVLRADRMLFSREVPPVACSLTAAVCPDYYTPPHGKQATLLIGTKNFTLSSSVSANLNGPNWWNGLSSSARLCYPSFKKSCYLPGAVRWLSENIQKRYRH